jgi:multidrug efflux pump subunit AcrA (membrane-fusion protein)
MRQARDELINLNYGVEEQQIKLDQSKFEPPATIKQAEIDLDKARRAHEQAKENYKIKHQQNKAKMRDAAASLAKAQRELDGMVEIQQAFRIIAPEDGMLIYKKGWDGKAIKEGGQISAWDPVVATLPDLSVMMSKTYINEVDVRKIKSGQMVEIGLDAFPEKQLKGKVINVANVGEQRPNSDAKVFQVNVEVAGSDPLLRPAMTTSNSIKAKSIENALFVPLETLHSQHDTITFVFKKDGLKTIRQEVQLGDTNSDEAVILAGLTETDRVYLSIPSGMDDEEVELIPEMSGKRTQEVSDEFSKEVAEEKPESQFKGAKSTRK